jgi:hypothetical protein
MISEITGAIAARGMQGRLSTWPVPASMALSSAGAEYAIRVLNGELPFDRIDEGALREAIGNYIKDYVGVDVDIQIRSFPDPASGRNIENYKLVLMGHLTF